MSPDDRDSHLAPPFVPAVEGDPSARRVRIEPPPRQVLEAVGRREPAALEVFFDAYFDHVYSLACRLLGDRTAAQDLTQEVFLKVHRAVGTLDPGRDPWPWLATVVANACRDTWRSGAYRMGRRSDSIDGDPARADALVAREAGPELLVLARERERLVRAAIAALPESHRQIVLLYEYEGLSHVEVAEVLGIEHAAARKRYSRALEALGQLLNETLGR